LGQTKQMWYVVYSMSQGCLHAVSAKPLSTASTVWFILELLRVAWGLGLL
jgi:hypothetical protein